MTDIIEGDRHFALKGGWNIAFYKKGQIAIENISKALNVGVISDLKKQQSSKQRFNGKDLKKGLNSLMVNW